MSYIVSHALMADYVNCTSLQAREAEFSRANCSDTEPSAQSNGNPTPKLSLWHDKTMDASRLSRFGMTCEHLMDTLGADVLTWYLEGFPVRTYPQPEKERGSKASDLECGKKWHGSLAKYDPDTCSWRTAQYSLLGGLGLSSVIWPRSGMTAGGQCWELPMLERRTSGIGCGFWQTPVAEKYWPTPQASDNRNRGNADTPAIARRIAIGKQVSLTMTVTGGQLSADWTEWLMGWPIGHTALKPSVTAKSRSKPPQLGDCLEGQ